MEEIFPELVCEKISQYIDFWEDLRGIRNLMSIGILNNCLCMEQCQMFDPNDYCVRISRYYPYTSRTLDIRQSSTFDKIMYKITKWIIC